MKVDTKEILNLWKEWYTAVSVDADTNENFQKRIALFSKAKEETEKFFKNEKRVYRYLIGSKIKEYPEPLYWYEWNRGSGTVNFAGSYTESEFNTKKRMAESAMPDYPFFNISRQELPMIEVK